MRPAPNWQAIRPYLIAAILVILAAALTESLERWLAPTPVLPYVAAVALSAFAGGLGAGLFAIALSVFAIELFAFRDPNASNLALGSVLRVAVFALVAGLVSWLNARRRAAETEVRASLAQVAASEEQLRVITDAVPALISYVGAEERFRFANRRYEEWIGVPQASLLGRSVKEILGPDVYAEAEPFITSALTGHPVTYEAEFRFAVVGPRKVEVNYVPDVAKDGMVRGFFALVVDVTARKQAEEHQQLLAEAGAVFAASLEVAATLNAVAGLVVPRLADLCAIHLLGDDGQLEPVAFAQTEHEDTTVARQLASRYSLDRESPSGLARVIRTGKAEVYPEVTEEMLASAARDPEHLATLRAAGVRSALIVPLTARGHTFGTITLAGAESGRRYNADDLRLAQELAHRAALAVSNARHYAEAQSATARYQRLFEQAGTAILILDDDGRIVDANAAATRLIGYSRDELRSLTKGSTELLAVVPMLATEQWERARDDGECRGQAELRRKDGTIIPVDAHIARVDLPSGPAYLALYHDESERHALEQLREEVFATIFHDLKNPLTAIRINAQVLDQATRAGSIDQSDLGEALKEIDEAAARMVLLIDDIVESTRLRFDQSVPLDLRETDLVQVVRETAEQYRAATAGHSLRLETPSPMVVGQWDPQRLERVAGNLLINAVKYSPAGTEIVVRVTREEDDGNAWAVLSVTDHGIGIPQADLPHIFDRFQRASNVGAVSGSGLGLAGVKQIVEQHGGSVTVTSVEGCGSTFTVRLPTELNGTASS